MKDGFEWQVTSEDKGDMIDSFQYTGTVRHKHIATTAATALSRQHLVDAPLLRSFAHSLIICMLVLTLGRH